MLPLDDSIFFAMSSQPEPSESDFLTNRVYACAALGQRFIGNSAFILKMSPSLSDMYSTKSSDAKRESTRASRLRGDLSSRNFSTSSAAGILPAMSSVALRMKTASEHLLAGFNPRDFKWSATAASIGFLDAEKSVSPSSYGSDGENFMSGEAFFRDGADFFAGTAVFWETFFFAAAGCAGTGFCAADFCAPPNAKCAEQIREKTPNALKNILPLSIYPDCSFMANRNLGARQDFFMSHSGEFSV